jgi:NAD(P)-dependent dehydrogenase (short-subunit alcohol dehydrogenase family)
MPNGPHSNKTAWITGAGTGIGAAAAERLAADGTHVVLSGRRVEPLEKVAGVVRMAGGDATVAPLDVSNADAACATAERILAALGGIDILVHSAGINIPNRAWADLTPEDFQRIQRINVEGAFHCVHGVLPSMRKNGGGIIIFISSWAGPYPSPIAGAAYSASKSALDSMTQVLNQEEGRHGIRACTVCPAEVATDILDERPKPPPMESRQYMLQPADLASLIHYIANCPPRMCLTQVILKPTHIGPFETPQA